MCLKIIFVCKISHEIMSIFQSVILACMCISAIHNHLSEYQQHCNYSLAKDADTVSPEVEKHLQKEEE